MYVPPGRRRESEYTAEKKKNEMLTRNSCTAAAAILRCVAEPVGVRCVSSVAWGPGYSMDVAYW